MTVAEKNYRSVINRLGGSLLLFFGLFLLYSLGISLFGRVMRSMPNRLLGEIVYQVVYGLLYAAVFCLPVLFFHLISHGKQKEPMRLAPTLPRETPLYILAGMGAIFACAYVNSFLLQFLHYNEFMQEQMDMNVSTNVDLVLALFTTAVVPAFVEEFLYRGLVLGNLLPYGRTTAVLASALLFGAMHQNAGQFFYATAAGVVLGLIFVKTGSIWCGVLVHFCNNAFSVIQSALAERLPAQTADVALLLTEGLVVALGLVSAVVLILRRADTGAAARFFGTFEAAPPADPEWSAQPISPARRVKLFFSVPMTLFLIICALMMAAMILLSQLV